MLVNYNGYSCEVFFGRYYNENIAIQLIDSRDGQVVTTATVNGESKLGQDKVGIKKWSGNEGIVEALVEGNVIEPELVGFEPTGFVTIEHYKLTQQALDEVEELKMER